LELSKSLRTKNIVIMIAAIAVIVTSLMITVRVTQNHSFLFSTLRRRKLSPPTLTLTASALTCREDLAL